MKRTTIENDGLEVLGPEEAPRAEQIAREASEESNLNDRPRCDPRVMAVGFLGYELAPWADVTPHVSRDAERVVAWYPANASEQEQALEVARMVADELIALAEWKPADPFLAAERIARALLLPAEPYLRDVDAMGEGSPELLAAWPLASEPVHAHRMVDLRGDGSIRSMNPDLALAVDAGALILPDPAIELVQRNGLVIRYNPTADRAARHAAIVAAVDEIRATQH